MFASDPRPFAGLSKQSILSGQRNVVAPVERITVQDANTATLWGLTDWQWSTLTDTERADYRDRIVYAPNHTAGK